MTRPPASARHQPSAVRGIITFAVSDPPAEPPAGCRDPGRWRSAHTTYRMHEPDASGRCARVVCREPHPCAVRRLAVRALIDAHRGPRHQPPLPGPDRTVATASCRWCTRAIELHSRYGWLHRAEGFLLCRRPTTGGLPLCQAEPFDPGDAQAVRWPSVAVAGQADGDSSRSATYTPTPGTP
jgi:hypothetical protein